MRWRGREASEMEGGERSAGWRGREASGMEGEGRGKACV